MIGGGNCIRDYPLIRFFVHRENLLAALVERGDVFLRYVPRIVQKPLKASRSVFCLMAVQDLLDLGILEVGVGMMGVDCRGGPMG